MNDNTHPRLGEQTEEQKSGKAAQKLKFYAVVALMSMLCLGFIWLIFSPAETDQPEGAAGLNTTVPAATVKTTEDDKRKAYEKEQYKEKQRDKQKTLQEISENYLTTDKPDKKTEPKPDPVRASHETYQQINRQMTSFYQTPKEDPQLADLKRQLVELSVRLEEKEKAPEPRPDPMELIEKSYELAAKYYPGSGNQTGKNIQSVSTAGPDKEPAVKVRRATDETTSTLAEPATLTLEERN